jgi:uncharacterized protein YlzI (FlbEa/FlbD family)
VYVNPAHVVKVEETPGDRKTAMVTLVNGQPFEVADKDDTIVQSVINAHKVHVEPGRLA